MEDDIGDEVEEDVFEQVDGEAETGPVPAVLEHVQHVACNMVRMSMRDDDVEGRRRANSESEAQFKNLDFSNAAKISRCDEDASK